MKERPILFSGDMVRAILDGRKTETRRVIKPQPELRPTDETVNIKTGSAWWWACSKAKSMIDVNQMRHFGPYGEPGDRLWVRETHVFTGGAPGSGGYRGPDGESWSVAVGYIADDTTTRAWLPKGEDHDEYNHSRWGTGKLYKTRPSIFMPRWASRILLEVTEVKVERVQEITWEGVEDEGVEPEIYDGEAQTQNSVPMFSVLWDSINEKRGYSWESNPWVWVVKFKVIEKRGATT